MVGSAVEKVIWAWRGRVLSSGVVAVLAAALVAGVSILVAAMRPAEAAFPGTAGDIAFTTDRDGSNQIYRMAADGYDPERLTDTAGRNDFPDWSSDGAMIAFTNDANPGPREIYVMEHDGDNEVNLTDDAAADEVFPVFFPGQRRIAFASSRDGDEEVWRMRADGTNPVNLTSNDAPADDFRPSWQPIP